MTSVMHQAQGIGLAANQVGAPVRMCTHKLGAVAPTTLINPEILKSAGVWEYTEGCLSLSVDGAAAPVVRPKTLLIRALTLDGRAFIANADELFARVLQHEVDHLNGIEYVQRLTGLERTRVYLVMNEHDIDHSWMPPAPYG